jgi:RNA-directed DNA polymerase
MSREVQVRFCESRAVRSRPATHLVVLVRGEAGHVEEVRDEITTVLAPLGLRLSPDKTRVVDMREGFDFLGFHIKWMRKRGTNKWFVYRTNRSAR